MTAAMGAYGQTMPAEECSPAGMRERAEHPPADRIGRAPPAAAAPAGASAISTEQPSLAAISAGSRMRGAAEPRYRITEMLGLGASGAVFEAQDQDLERAVALKVLRVDAEAEAAAGFLGEARIAAALAHPNVPPILDVDLAVDGRPFFTMHKVNGRTLQEVMGAGGSAGSSRPLGATATSPARDAPEPPPGAPAPDRHAINRLVSIGIAVCNGLAYAHAHGIVHQDIKPENLLIGAYGEVLILDWGSSGRFGADGRVHGRLYGTPLYMSPEQARADWAEARSDVFALGATLFHALVGRVPWWDPSPEAFWDGKRAGHLNEPTPQERERVPTELLAILAKALAPAPEARYATITEMRRDLEHFQSGLRVDAYRYSVWSSLGRWCRQHPTLLSSSAVALLAALLGWALLAHQRALERHRWHLVEHYAFTSLAETQRQWRGWTHLGWDDNVFVATALDSPDYTVAGGSVTIGGKSDAVDLTCERAVMGNVRIAWTAEGLLSGQNLNCFIGGTDRTKGYTIHVGGYGTDHRLVLTVGSAMRELEWLELPHQLVPHHPYRMVLEREDRHLRLWVDDDLVLDHIDVEDPAGDAEERFGFDTYGDNQLRISDVSVYRQTPAQLVSPLVIPDQLFQLRQWEEARDRYQEIADAFPDSAIATTAAFRAAQCVSAKGDQAAADQALAAFVSAHPRDVLVPTALAERFAYALGRRDAAAQEAIFAAILPFAPNPVITGMLAQKSQQLAEHLPSDEEMMADPRRFDDLLAVARGYKAWWSQAGAFPYDDQLLNQLEIRLDGCGRPDLAQELIPEGSVVQERVLIQLGRMAEACAPRFTQGWGPLAQGRLRAAADAPRGIYGARARAYVRLGEWGHLAAINPRSPWLLVNNLRTPADLDRAIDQLPLSKTEKKFGVTTRLSLLLARGRAAEALRDYYSPPARGAALCALGRCEEALSMAPFDGEVCLWCAHDALVHGHPERAIAILDQAPNHTYEHSRLDSMLLASALLYTWAGAPERARALLAKELVRKERGEQRFWHAASYVLGTIDFATFRAQPSQYDIESDTELCTALRCELAGDRAGADACYARLVAQPLWKRCSGLGIGPGCCAGARSLPT